MSSDQCEIYCSKIKDLITKFFFTLGFQCCFWIQDPGWVLWIRMRTLLSIPYMDPPVSSTVLQSSIAVMKPILRGTFIAAPEATLVRTQTGEVPAKWMLRHLLPLLPRREKLCKWNTFKNVRISQQIRIRTSGSGSGRTKNMSNRFQHSNHSNCKSVVCRHQSEKELSPVSKKRSRASEELQPNIRSVFVYLKHCKSGFTWPHSELYPNRKKNIDFTILCICYCLSWNNDEKIPESIQKIFWMAMSSLIRNTISKFIHCNHFRSVPDDGPAPSNRLPDDAGDVGTSSLPYRKEAR